MIFLLNIAQVRPSILETNKDADYHRRFARYCIGNSSNFLQTSFMDKIAKNKRFYKGDQWTETEDIDSFLKDDTGQDRNRLAITQNVIRPMVEQYRGNAIRMTLNFKVKSVSPQAINRREKLLAKQLFMSELANEEGNPFGEAMKGKMAIGDNEAETTASFNNLYVDEYIKSMNNLLTFIVERNEFDQMQVRLAEEMALSGLGVVKNFEFSGHHEFIITPSETFFFDRSAKRYDLKDASYMGDVIELDPTEIYETYPDLSDGDRENIENYVRHMSGNTTNIGGTSVPFNGKIPVATTYWRDGQRDEYGYVRDEFGYEYLTRINYVAPGQKEPMYTDKDLIQTTSVRGKKLLSGKLKTRLYYDVLRVAKFIPSEIIAAANINSKEERIPDVMLDWGIAPYQEVETLEYNSVKFPYKCYCWGYLDGEILSPIDDAIDPQRFINRIWSVAENQINNSRGSGTVIDGSMVTDQDETLRNMNQSKPIFITAKGRGIQNAVGAYDSTVKSGTEILYRIIDAMKASIKETSGVNDALRGESTGSDQLVGVTQLLIQRGSLMQEPFYNGMVHIFKECSQAAISVGKRIYLDSDRNIAISVGDDGAEIIKLSKDMRTEDFRTFVKRENSDEMLADAADQMLLVFRDRNMLDDKRVAKLWGRSTPDEVANELRKFAAEKEELAKMAAKQEQAQEQSLMAQADMEQQEQAKVANEQVARDDIKHLTDLKAKKDAEIIKGVSKIAPNNKKAQDMLINAGENLQR
jgi:hypothetical protein